MGMEGEGWGGGESGFSYVKGGGWSLILCIPSPITHVVKHYVRTSLQG